MLCRTSVSSRGIVVFFYVFVFWCVNDSYLAKVLELLQQITSAGQMQHSCNVLLNPSGQLRRVKLRPQKVFVSAPDRLRLLFWCNNQKNKPSLKEKSGDVSCCL